VHNIWIIVLTKFQIIDINNYLVIHDPL